MKKLLFGLLFALVLLIPKLSHASSGIIVVGSSWSQCVTYVQAVTRTTARTRDGYARTFPINTYIPRIGEIVVLRGSWTGHVALVIGVTKEWIHIREANYIPGKITQRWIRRHDWRIKGYWRVLQKV